MHAPHAYEGPSTRDAMPRRRGAMRQRAPAPRRRTKRSLVKSSRSLTLLWWRSEVKAESTWICAGPTSACARAGRRRWCGDRARAPTHPRQHSVRHAFERRPLGARLGAVALTAGPSLLRRRSRCRHHGDARAATAGPASLVSRTARRRDQACHGQRVALPRQRPSTQTQLKAGCGAAFAARARRARPQGCTWRGPGRSTPPGGRVAVRRAARTNDRTRPYACWELRRGRESRQQREACCW